MRGEVRILAIPSVVNSVSWYDLAVRWLIVLTLLTGCAGPDPQPDIEAVLHAQVEAWNRGDIEGFLEGYWHSPDTVFASGDRVTRGFDEMASRYREHYPNREAMGALAFSELAFEQVTDDRAVVTGRWELQAADGEIPGGVFTLILRRFPEGWRIVHDHTSSR